MTRNMLPAVLTILAGPLWAGDFLVEGESRMPVPGDVATVIHQSKEKPEDDDGKPCRLVGNSMDLQNAGAAQDWVVTTAEACAWAANTAPIWVVRRGKHGYTLVLTHMTYDLTVGKQSQNGMRHIATGRATALRSSEELWKFDGRQYRMVRSKVREYGPR